MKYGEPVTQKLIASLVIVFVAGATVSGCGNDISESDSNDEECCPWCTGPDGGVIEIDNPDSFAFGAKIEVPPGAWDHCRALQVEDIYSYTPPFPAGFYAYRGYRTSFDVFAGGDVPDSLYMEITFPIADVTPLDSTEIAAAFYYDEVAETWRIVLPDEIDDQEMLVKSHLYRKKWSWGFVSILEADFQESLAPLLEDLHGQQQWSQLVSELDSIYNALTQEDLDLSCASLDFVEGFFEALKSEARAALQAHQASIGNSCGTCDILTSEFHAGFAKFIELNIQYFFLELMFVETGPNLLIMAYGINRLCEIQVEIDNLACDYKCYFSNATSDFWGNLAAYYISSAVLFAIDYAKTSGYVSCGPASGEITMSSAALCPARTDLLLPVRVASE
jgi:hypothetical protein